MIDTKYPTPDVFDDAVTATAYIARVDVTHGELRLPPRVREHLADGDVVVHLVRGEDDETQCTATLTAASKLIGIAWPADIVAGSRVVVMCPRGAAGHDVAVQLPDLPEPTVTFLGPVPDDEADAEPLVDLAEWNRLADRFATKPAVETALAGPADYEVPTVLRTVPRDEQPTEIIANAGDIGWPADEDDYIAEQVAEWEELDDDEFGLYADDEPATQPPAWRRFLGLTRADLTATRAVYTVATGSTFLGALVAWLVTK